MTQVVILAGGFGTRIREYPEPVPKPMVPVGGKPIIWHIMKGYAHYGFNDFIICLGYKAEKVRDYFLNYSTLNNDVSLDIGENHTKVSKIHTQKSDETNWKVTLVDTGVNTMTGGRIKRVADYIRTENFFLSYGDTLCNINFKDQLGFHLRNDAEITITGVHQRSRFGHIQQGESSKIQHFVEKPVISDLVSGGFFVANKSVLDLIKGDEDTFESDPLQMAVKRGRFYCWDHKGFWSCMDTMRDHEYLNELYSKKEHPWIVWN